MSLLPRRLDFDVCFDAFSVSASIPLGSVEDALNDLVRHNITTRERDDCGPSVVSVRVVCPGCRAPVFCLTRVERNGELLRACRRCGHEFPVEV